MGWLLPILIIASAAPVGAIVGIVTAILEIRWEERIDEEGDE